MKGYKKNGFVQQAAGSIIALAISAGVLTLVLIFVPVLGGQTFQLSESKINAISNTTVQQKVKDTAISGFDVMKQTGDFSPIVFLALMIVVVLAVILSIQGLAGGGYGGRGGGAL